MKLSTSRTALNRLLGVLSAALPLALLGAPAQAAVMISQVYGGGGNGGAPYLNDFVELHNSGSSAVSLSGYSLQYSSATGSSWANQNIALNGTIPAGGYYLIQMGSGGSAGVSLPIADASASVNMSATAGKLALVSNGTALTGTCPTGGAIVDFVGYGTTANCSEGSVAPVPSATLGILRASAGNSCQDTNNNGSDFSTAAPIPRNTAAAPQACGGTGGGGGGGGTPVAKKIYEVQGSGSTSPFVGQTVITQGVVTKINNNGFFIQDATGDGNPLTSDGIFVFTGTTTYPAVAVGNLVEVTGPVVEFNVGTSADTAAHTVTEISPASSVTFINSGFTITPVVVTLPELVNDDLERYEGMLVTLAGPLTVQQNFFQGRYGQLTLAVGGRLETPTNRYRAGTPQAIALADENARRRVILDDGSSLQNPNPIPYLPADGIRRAGDTLGSVTGVIDYGLATNSSSGAGDYKIHPTVTPVFSNGNLRTTAPEAVGGNIKVASFNVLNYFTAFVDGTGTANGCTLNGATSTGNCRGANNAAEFARQRTKIVKAMVAIDADVYGLMEIQNNGNTAAQDLVNALNAEVGAGTYATTSLPANTGTDAIRVAMFYKVSKLTPFGAAVSDNDAINNRPTLAQTFTVSNGERFTLLVNHLKSKGSCPSSGDSDYAGNFDNGDGQGCWNLQRVQQAQRLRTFVAQRQAAVGSNDVLLIGDFNAYGMEDPIVELTSNGYIDQAGRFSSVAYSYVFDGAAGRLDHAIATATLSAKVNRVMHWHINADEPTIIDYNTEFKAPAMTCGLNSTSACPTDPYTPTPYRSSDHDPVVVGLNLYNKITVGTTGADTLVGTGVDTLFIGGVGADMITGGSGRNGFAYQTMRDAGDTITDFVPGKDRIDLSLLLASLGIPSGTALANGNVKLMASGANTLLQIDTDGDAGAVLPRTLVTLLNVSPLSINTLRDLGLPAPAAATRVRSTTVSLPTATAR